MSNTPKTNLATTSYQATPQRRQREPVLTVLHADGWVEHFAEKHVDVHTVVMPYLTTVEGRIAAEEYLESTLPLRYRELYFPGNLRAADLVRIITPSDIERVKWNLEFLDVLKQVGEEFRNGNPDGSGGKKIWTL